VGVDLGFLDPRHQAHSLMSVWLGSEELKLQADGAVWLQYICECIAYHCFW
jgi:hypothetical protein